LGTPHLAGGHHLHGPGDLRNIADAFDASLDVTNV
jgi:hypothetical protein